MNGSNLVRHETNNGKYGLRARKRYLALMAVLIISGVVVWSYAATLLSVSNVATIETGANLVATGAVPQGTTCGAETGAYTDSPMVNWGNVPTGTTQSKFVCLENTGTGNYQVSIASNLPSSDGSISSPQAGQTIASSSFLLVEVDWNVSPQATLGGVSFTITFQ